MKQCLLMCSIFVASNGVTQALTIICPFKYCSLDILTHRYLSSPYFTTIFLFLLPLFSLRPLKSFPPGKTFIPRRVKCSTLSTNVTIYQEMYKHFAKQTNEFIFLPGILPKCLQINFYEGYASIITLCILCVNNVYDIPVGS